MIRGVLRDIVALVAITWLFFVVQGQPFTWHEFMFSLIFQTTVVLTSRLLVSLVKERLAQRHDA